MTGPFVVVASASARWLAQSVRRAGFDPIAIDPFGDRDLMACAPASVCLSSGWPDAIPDAIARLPAGPVVPGAGLENHPAVVAAIARDRTVWGADHEAIAGARDPWRLAEAVRAAGFGSPPLRRRSAGLPLDGSWLRKPTASGGGRGVRAWTARLARRPAPEPVYFQQRIVGPGFGASYDGDRLLGVTAALRGAPGEPFGFAGGIGPVRLGTRVRRCLERLGGSLAVGFGLRGLFGVDLVVDRNGCPWVVELNPRPTASVELLELAWRRSVLAGHAHAFDARLPAPNAWPGRDGALPPRRVGRAILYASATCRLAPSAEPWVRSAAISPRGRFDVPALADLPRSGSRFRRGDPVLSVYAEAASIASVRGQLARRVRASRRFLTGEVRAR